MPRSRRLALAVLGSLVLVSGVPEASGQAGDWQFRTPGDAAYCSFAGDIRCVRPADGFWIRISGAIVGPARVTKGYDESLRGFRNRRVRVLRFGDAWISSDAAVYTCVSRRTALTCHEVRGRAFRLERSGGHRIYRGPSGSIPQVERFFRTGSGFWCGNSSAGGGGEPSYMVLGCWRTRDGTAVFLPHAQRERRAATTRNPHAREFRPPGFRFLPAGDLFVWRCRKVGPRFADRCSADDTGTIVFLCRATKTGTLRCVNRFGRGFVLGQRKVAAV
jgi:hypothetical protein